MAEALPNISGMGVATDPSRLFNRSKTTYSGMNSWHSYNVGHTTEEGLPNINNPPADSDFSLGHNMHVNQVPNARPQTPSELRSAEYRRRFEELSKKVAYRYPNPGPPREHKGCMGGHWRHIKEVLGHSGSQVVFVDGLVRLYDYDQNAGHSRRLSDRRYAHTPVYSQTRQEHKQSNKLDTDQSAGTARSSHQSAPESSNKYKGFYTSKQRDTVY